MNKKGFTLMELLIVVVLISGFAAMTYPSYKISLERARASEAVSMVGAIKAAEEKHFVSYEEYGSTYHDINDFEPGIENANFDPNSSSFNTEYFRYTIVAGQKKVQASRIKNGVMINKGYRIDGFFEERFIRCVVTNNDGDKVCTSLTDKDKVGDYYPIF